MELKTRAQILADRVEKAHHQLIMFIQSCSREDWRVLVPQEKRTVGVLAHHVASLLPEEVRILETVASGRPVTGLTTALLDEMNARHAREHADCTRQETLALLEHNSSVAVEAIRGMSDREMDSAAPVSLHWDAPLTAQYIIEEHSLSHTYRHLSAILAVLGQQQ